MIPRYFNLPYPLRFKGGRGIVPGWDYERAILKHGAWSCYEEGQRSNPRSERWIVVSSLGRQCQRSDLFVRESLVCVLAQGIIQDLLDFVASKFQVC